LFGCASNEIITRNYYIIEYYAHNEKEDLIREEPLDFSVIVKNTKISRTYDRKQIVFRKNGPKIVYSNHDLWGVALSDIIPDMIAKRMKNYNSFTQVQREFFKELPDLQLQTTINNIEILESSDSKIARLNMEFSLMEMKSEKIILRHYVEKEKEIIDGTVDGFVQNINDFILEETDNFINKVYKYYSGDLIEEADNNENIEDMDFNLVDSYQEGVTAGTGMLLMPSLTKSDNEEYYYIIDNEQNTIVGRFGEVKSLPKGKYTLRFGSGDISQQMVIKDVNIYPRYRQIIEPTWGCLIVEIIDKNRNYAKVNYEIFSIKSGESFGSEFPADEAVGEQDKVWVLKPGIYKIVINNEPFNTYTNFTTVQIDANKSKQLTIVVDTDDEGNPLDMVGAGILEDIGSGKDLSKSSYSHAIHANLNLYSDNSVNKDEQIYSITTNIQYDSHFQYDNYPYHYTLKTLLEEGATKTTDTDLRKSADELDIRNTILYYLFEEIGFYGRLDFNTHLINDYVYLGKGVDYVKFSSDEELEEFHAAEENESLEMKKNSSFFPLEMKQGFGINLQLLNGSNTNLSLRGGLGFRQDLNKDVYSTLAEDSNLAQQDTIAGYDLTNANKYIALENNFTEGTEISAVANFKLPVDLSYSTYAEILIPFDKEESVSTEWENSFDLRLFKYVSLNYKLKLSNKPSELGDDYWLTEHSLFLRISYFIR
jgi:ABC-type uncharacterized transport system auxiliary subunit